MVFFIISPSYNGPICLIMKLVHGLLFFLLLSGSICSQVNISDSLVLVEFYHAMDGDNWINNDGWLTDRPYDQWYGISAHTGRFFIRIDLNENNLKGELPSSLGKLEGLLSLSLYYNEISGNLPDSICQCEYLESIILSGNKLTSLGNNLNECRNLGFVQAGENSIGVFPPDLSGLVKLKEFHINHNPIAGTIPKYFGKLTSLRVLDLRNTMLHGKVPSLKGLENLEVLRLEYNDLEGELKYFLADSSKISVLRLQNNRFSGDIPAYLFREDQLEVLWMSNNQFSGLGDFTDFTNLSQVYLDRNKLNISHLLPFADMSIWRFFYNDQSNRGEPMEVEVPRDSSISLMTDADGIGTNYIWRRNGLELTDKLDPVLTITNFSEKDNGIYDCLARHPKLPDLELYTEEVILKLKETVSVTDPTGSFIRIYPNPVVDFVFIDLKEPCQLRWLDVDGRVIGDKFRLEVGKHQMFIPPSLMNSQVLLLETIDQDGHYHVVKLIRD